MEEKILKLVEGYFKDSAGYKLIDLNVRGERNNKIVEVYADNEQGVAIDELSRINRELNDLIDKEYDEKDILKLVVSSPGVDRPFKFIWQLRKHTGRIVDVILASDEKLEGKLLEVHDEPEKYIIIDTSVTAKKGKKPKPGKAGPALHKIYFDDIKESKIKLSF